MQRKLLVQPIVYTGARRLGIREEKNPPLLVSKLCSYLKNCWNYSYPESPRHCSGSLRGNLESHLFAWNQNHSDLPYRPLDSCWCDSWVWRSSLSEDQSVIRLVQYRLIWSYLGSQRADAKSFWLLTSGFWMQLPLHWWPQESGGS